MKRLVLVITIISCLYAIAYAGRYPGSQSDTPLIIRQCNNFTVTGNGDSPEWQKTNWVPLVQLDNTGKPQESKFKVMYSSTGIYVLFTGQDEKITSNFTKDFENLYNGDVFEVFFHPDVSQPIYFEYEVSPLNKELVLIIANRKDNFGRWLPWHYEENKVNKNVKLSGGNMAPGSNIQGWTAELFFPYKLLSGLANVPPKSGTQWKANFCRLDYDSGKMTKWSWSPVKSSFHEFDKYLLVRFE